MKPEPAHYAAARAKFNALKDSGKSPTADPQRYWEGITDAVLALVPEPKQPRSPRPRRAT